MDAIKKLEAQLSKLPVTDQAAHRAVYAQISRLYAEQLRPTR